MKAITYSAPRQFAYTNVRIPRPGRHQVLVQVRACGFCGTHLHIHEGEFIVKYPLISGHEFAGAIVDLGEDVTDLQVGDRVVADNMTFCGHCFHCTRGRPLYCDNLRALGVTDSGGFAEYVIVDAARIYVTRLSWRQAVMVEPTPVQFMVWTFSVRNPVRTFCCLEPDRQG